MIPKDPIMLLSFINLKLRDYYSSLDDLCDDMDIDKEEIINKLSGIDYHYDKEKNAFLQNFYCKQVIYRKMHYEGNPANCTL